MRGARALGAALGLACLAGCMPRATTPAPPSEVRSVTILPPKNRTGGELLVTGGSALETYVFHTERVTVEDVIAGATEALLQTRGYRVTAGAPGSGVTDGLLLTIEIRRWEPDSWTHPEFVIAGVSATLLDRATGRALWSAHPPVHPIATPGAVVPGAAYEVAAHKIVAELFASWPARGPS